MKVKELKEYKQSLYASLSRELANFERNFLLISGAVFSFSITFLNEVITLKGAEVLWLLFVSWGCFIVSIFLMMWTYLYSANSSDKLNQKVGEFIMENNLFNENMTLSSSKEKDLRIELDSIFYNCKANLRYMRYFAVGMFVIGLVALSIFVGFNIENNNVCSSLDK